MLYPVSCRWRICPVSYTHLSRELAKEIDDAGVSVVYVTVNEREVKVISNGMVDIQKFVNFDAVTECDINERVRFSVLAEILGECGDDDEALKDMILSLIHI